MNASLPRLTFIAAALLVAAGAALGADATATTNTADANPLVPRPSRSSTNATAPDRRATPPTNSAPSFADFRLITERNIFDTRRSPRSQPQNERRETRRASRVDFVTLLGTMQYSKGPFAFFEGSSSDYTRTVNPGDKIAGHGIAAIEHNRVLLQSGTNWIELAVGKQLRREDNGSWKVADAPERQIASYGGGSSSSSSSYGSSRSGFASSSVSRPPETTQPQPTSVQVILSEGAQPQVAIDPETGAAIAIQPLTDPNLTNAPAAAAPAGGPNDVLMRLMQKREEQLNR